MLTSKGGGDEDGGEAADTANEGSIADEPVVSADILMVCVPAAVDGDSKDDEYLSASG